MRAVFAMMALKCITESVCQFVTGNAIMEDASKINAFVRHSSSCQRTKHHVYRFVRSKMVTIASTEIVSLQIDVNASKAIDFWMKEIARAFPCVNQCVSTEFAQKKVVNVTRVSITFQAMNALKIVQKASDGSMTIALKMLRLNLSRTRKMSNQQAQKEQQMRQLRHTKKLRRAYRFI